MLAPAKVNPIDHAFDAVLAPAAVVMTDRPKACAGLARARVATRVGEPPTVEQGQFIGQLAQHRAPSECNLGDPVVGAAQVVAHFFFTFAITADDTTPG